MFARFNCFDLFTKLLSPQDCFEASATAGKPAECCPWLERGRGKESAAKFVEPSGHLAFEWLFLSFGAHLGFPSKAKSYSLCGEPSSRGDDH